MKVKGIILAAVAGALACGVALAQDGKSWPMFMGAQQNAISNETGWSTNWPEGGPKVLWKKNIGIGFSAESIANGKLYTMGNADGKDTVYCLDAGTGAEVWKFTYDCVDPPIDKEKNPGPRATPTVDGNRVYTISRNCQLYCFNADTGEVVWQQDFKKTVGAKSAPFWGYGASPLVLGDMLILETGVKKAAVCALNKTDGTLLWKSGEGESNGYSTPVVYTKDGKQLLAVFLGDGLIGLDAKTGAPLYKFPYKCKWNLTICEPLVVGDKIFISAGYGGGSYLVDVSGAEPKSLWNTVEFSNQRTTSVLWKGYLYGIDGDQDRKPFLKCYDFATGKEKWSQPGTGNGSLMMADGKLIVQCDGGKLIVVDANPDGYKELASCKPLDGQCWTMPVLCGGRIYCRNHAGDLVCLDVSGK